MSQFAMPRYADRPFDGEEAAERIREGDRAAFEGVFLAYYEDLCRFMRRYVDSCEIAEDLVQDLFLDLWERRGRWELKRSLRAYLYGAARNRALKHLRRQRVRKQWQRQERYRAEPRGEDPAEALRHSELKRAAQKALAELPERRRLIYLLSRQHGLTYKEIAAALDISVKTVETQMGRALKFLRERLSAHLSVSL